MNKKQKMHQTTVPGNGLGVRVTDGDIGYALKQFKRRVKKSAVLQKTFDRAEFTKPSVLKRAERSKAAFIQQIRSREQ
jgi:small subunit ribosomal protein S21